MKQHRFWAWGAVICMVMVMITGYKRKQVHSRKEETPMMKHYVRLACFVGGALFGSAGVKLLTSKDAKKAYTHITAAGLRMKDCVMETVTSAQENAADILAAAKDINEARAAKEAEAQVEGQEA